MDREPPKDSKWPAEGQLYLGFDQGQCAHLGSSGGRLNSNLPGSAWLLGVLSQAPGSIPGSRSVRIDPA